MKTRAEIIALCSTYEDIMEDYPFHDANWTLMRHKKNKKTFVCIYVQLHN